MNAKEREKLQRTHKPMDHHLPVKGPLEGIEKRLLDSIPEGAVYNEPLQVWLGTRNRYGDDEPYCYVHIWVPKTEEDLEEERKMAACQEEWQERQLHELAKKFGKKLVDD